MGWKLRFKRIGNGEKGKYFGKVGEDVVVARDYSEKDAAVWIIVGGKVAAMGKKAKKGEFATPAKALTAAIDALFDEMDEDNEMNKTREGTMIHCCWTTHILINCNM